MTRELRILSTSILQSSGRQFDGAGASADRSIRIYVLWDRGFSGERCGARRVRKKRREILADLPSSRHIRLPNTVPVRKDESLVGWLIRASEAQGYMTLNFIEDLIGTKLEMMEREEWADAVARMLAADSEEIRYRARRRDFVTGTPYRQATSRVHYFGHELSDGHLSFARAPVCPACLAQYTGSRAYRRNARFAQRRGRAKATWCWLLSMEWMGSAQRAGVLGSYRRTHRPEAMDRISG